MDSVKLIENLQDKVDDIKTKITDNEYKVITDNIQDLYKQNKSIYKVLIYYPYIKVNVCNHSDELTTFNNLEIRELNFLSSINDNILNHPIFNNLLSELYKGNTVKCGHYIKEIFDYLPLEFKYNNDYIFTNINKDDETYNFVFNVDTMIDDILVKITKV
jgi:hypothetical protein